MSASFQIQQLEACLGWLVSSPVHSLVVSSVVRHLAASTGKEGFAVSLSLRSAIVAAHSHGIKETLQFAVGVLG